MSAENASPVNGLEGQGRTVGRICRHHQRAGNRSERHPVPAEQRRHRAEVGDLHPQPEKAPRVRLDGSRRRTP